MSNESDKPVMWVKVEEQITAVESERILDGLNETFGDGYNIIVRGCQ